MTNGSRAVVLFLFALAAGCSTVPRPPGLARCVWVTRWDYRTAGDVRRVMEDCARGGFTSVMFQVRGNGTVLYPSGLEVWSEAFGFEDPGFDPLEVAVTEGHARGLEVHAWVNVVPGWQGAEPPASERQLWNSRPGWFLADTGGRREPMEEGRYLGLNPCLPEVRRHLAELCGEIATRYRVDGIHLDYVRFTDADHPGGATYPADPRSIGLFQAETGETMESDPEAFARWKADCVTRLVEGIRRRVQGVELTAAVIADPEEARGRFQQDWPRWTEEGLVDAVFPMNYSDDDRTFQRRTEVELEAGDGVPVVVVVGAYKHRDPEQTVRQMESALAAGASGVGLFSYRSLFGSGGEATAAEKARQRHILTWNLTRE